VLDIYAASEKPIDGVTAEFWARQNWPEGEPQGRPHAFIREAAAAASALAQPGDMILTLGAGNVSQLGPDHSGMAGQKVVGRCATQVETRLAAFPRPNRGPVFPYRRRRDKYRLYPTLYC